MTSQAVDFCHIEERSDKISLIVSTLLRQLDGERYENDLLLALHGCSATSSLNHKIACKDPLLHLQKGNPFRNGPLLTAGSDRCRVTGKDSGGMPFWF
jgi:hypothetical protein